MASIVAALVAALAASGCGYRVVGRTNTLPADAQTIAIPAFTNQTTTYRIEQMLTESVVHEFIARTKYRVVPEPDGADLVLHGQVTGLARRRCGIRSRIGRHDDCSGHRDGQGAIAGPRGKNPVPE